MLSLSRDKVWLIAGGLLALLVVAIGYLFFVSPQYTSAADLRSQTSDAINSVSIKQAHLNDLAKQNANLATYEAQLATDQQALPSTTDIPAFLRTLQTIGSSSGISVTAISVGSPTAVTAAAAPKSSGSTTATTTTTHAGVAGGAYAITISLTATGPVPSLDKFLQALQSTQPRAVLVTSVTLSAGNSSTNAGTTMALGIQAFMAPAS